MGDDRDLIDELKQMVPIDTIIREDEPLQDPGRRYLHGLRHDSLVIDTRRGSYHWNSRGEQGDVISWLQDHRGMDFKTAVEHLAGRAGMQAPDWGHQSQEARIAARAKADTLTIAARFFVRKLRESTTAQAYCQHRGWTTETVQAMGLGYWDGDTKDLQAELRMHEVDMNLPAVRSLLHLPSGVPHGYLIYPHIEWGKVVYLSMRLAYSGDKKMLNGILPHYNLPADLVGERKPYWNATAIPGQGAIVVVEGQADAVTLEQMGIAAVALAGVKVGNTDEGRRLLLQLGKQDAVFVGLDQDDAGARGAQALADVLGSQIRVARWDAHDINDWLIAAPAACTPQLIQQLLRQAPTYVEVFAGQIAGLEGSERQLGLKSLFRYVLRLNDFTRDVLREKLASAAALKLREFDRLLKTTEQEIGRAHV